MNIIDLLTGKKVLVTADIGITAELEIKEVKVNQHSVDLEEATPANDWWPRSREWNTYIVYFTNGYKKEFNNLEEINLVQPK